MSGLWLRKGTWAGVAVACFAMGALVVRAFAGEPRAVLAEPPTHEIVSRAADSETEVSPALAALKDGTLAVAWIAMGGGRDGVGRYVGVRVSPVGGGKLGPLMRLRGEPNAPIADASIVPASGGGFIVVWRAGYNVYDARISREGVGEPKAIALGTRARAAVSSNGTIVVAIASHDKLTLATSPDGDAFALRDAGGAIGDGPLGVCADDHLALVAWVDDARGIHASRVLLDAHGSATRLNVSNVGEHAAVTAPSCFVAAQDAFVVYGLTDKPQDDAENSLSSSLVFAHSKDGAENFLIHTPYRPPMRLMHPTLLHDASSFTLLAVMGSGLGDAHASASVILLGADGRMQNGLTQTIIAPVTMSVARDAAGYTGDSLGLAVAASTTWTAVADNQAGESHVALVAMPR